MMSFWWVMPGGGAKMYYTIQSLLLECYSLISDLSTYREKVQCSDGRVRPLTWFQVCSAYPDCVPLPTRTSLLSLSSSLVMCLCTPPLAVHTPLPRNVLCAATHITKIIALISLPGWDGSSPLPLKVLTS